MYRRYEEIREKLGEPLWHDDQGVPRYIEFHPSLCGVYDTHVALLNIACQSCGKRFLVAASYNAFIGFRIQLSLPTSDEAGSFGFGDAPYHGGCAGETMTTDTMEIVQFWFKRTGDWIQLSELQFRY
jgi:hypothetical protein